MSQPSPAPESPGKGAPQPAASSAEREVRLRNVLSIVALSLLILVMAYMILEELTSILRPLLIAVFVCYLIVPAHHWLVAHRLPSALSYIVIVGGILSIMYGIGNMALRSIGQMSNQLPQYIEGFQKNTDAIVQTLKDKWETLTERDRSEDESKNGKAAERSAGSRLGQAETNPTTMAASAPTSGPADANNAQERWKPFPTRNLIQMGRSTLEAFLGLFTSAMVVVFYLIFLLAEVAGFNRRLSGALGTQRAEQVMGVVRKINAAISRYIAIKTFVSLLIGAFSGIVLALFGVDYAFLWAVVTFLANFIPYVGSMAAVILPIGLSLVQFGDPWTTVILAAILTVAQMVVGYWLEPWLIGQKLGVSPLVIVLSLAFWGLLWGIPGMVLAVPLAVALKIIFENMDSTRPLARLCSDI